MRETLDEIERMRKEEVGPRIIVGALAGAVFGPFTCLLLTPGIEWGNWTLFLILADGLGGGLAVWYLTIREESSLKLKNTDTLQRIAVSGLLGLEGGILAIPVFSLLLLASCFDS